ncbi:MAG: diguanylate cyclase [Coleofasciculus sp. C1-SOL-03]|jgi:diguanylate cyclase (GGDEF)-like protein|uniref:diguanylate cyclase n=1 Tax=Coleofasciculus sp. C1-SOL-03 TaxID=3069522 RepID=UPI003301E0E1
MKNFCPENFLILIVDDNPNNLQILHVILETEGYTTIAASNEEDAIERVRLDKPDLIIMALTMPKTSGLELCDHLKSPPPLTTSPIILMRTIREQEYLIEAFEKGAADTITHPFNPAEILARVRTHLELKQTQKQLNRLVQEQEKLTKLLRKLASTDPLTGLWNRRHFLTIGYQEFNRACRYKRSLSILMIDLDNFKQINEEYGHTMGDEVLKGVAKSIVGSLREADYCGRCGGEEFVTLLPETDSAGAMRVAERLRKRLEQITIGIGDKQVQMTVTVGVASYQLDDSNIEVIIQRAHKALYHAKSQGYNRVVLH